MRLAMSSEVQQILTAVRTLCVEDKRALANAINQELQPRPERPTREDIEAIIGKYAHLPGSVDEFLARKREDLELEEH